MLRDAISVVLIDTNILAYLMIEGDRTDAAQEPFERYSDWCSETFGNGGVLELRIGKTSPNLRGTPRIVMSIRMY